MTTEQNIITEVKNIEELSKAMEELSNTGYIIECTERGTYIYEPFISKIDGEIYKRDIAWSTKQNDYDFIIRVYKEGHLKTNQ